jgi:hypothetical protein
MSSIDFKPGMKVRIIHLEGEDNAYDGIEGEITYIDAIGQLHGTWGGLAIIPEADEFEVIADR